MGYKRPKRIFKLKFTDPEMGGLEVRAKSTSLGGFLTIAKLVDLKDRLTAGDDAIAEVEELFSTFAKCLVSWNLLDDDDSPVPPTKDGLLSQDLDFVLEIIGAWAQAIGGVSTPLAMPSRDGARLLEESLPMEPLTPSLAS